MKIIAVEGHEFPTKESKLIELKYLASLLLDPETNANRRSDMYNNIYDSALGLRLEASYAALSVTMRDLVLEGRTYSAEEISTFVSYYYVSNELCGNKNAVNEVGDVIIKGVIKKLGTVHSFDVIRAVMAMKENKRPSSDDWMSLLVDPNVTSETPVDWIIAFFG